MGKQVPLDDLRHARFKSIWCAKNGREAAKLLHRDYVIRRNIEKFCRTNNADLIRSIIRGSNKCDVEVVCMRPGVLIGKGKGNIEILQNRIQDSAEWYRIGKIDSLNMSAQAVSNPELDADAIAVKIAADLERRRSFNMSMKMNRQEAMRFGALGIMITCSGRLNGVEIARCVTLKAGQVCRKTIRANTFYGFRHAYTNSGTCGVKVRINLPDEIPTRPAMQSAPRKPFHKKPQGSKPIVVSKKENV